MLYGYNGKILKVDLSNEKIWIEEPSEVFYRTYMGGRNIGAYYLLKETPSNVDPLSPENIVVFAISVISGAPIPGPCKYSVVTKSPLTNAYGEAEAGGFWGAELKFAGFDAIVIKGKAVRPVYLWINNGRVEIKDAAHLWGKTTGECEYLIKKELKNNRIKVSQIGIAGENKVKYACVIADIIHANGRTGAGAVLGSKNLKAIAVKGDKTNISFYNVPYIKEMGKIFHKTYHDTPFLSSSHYLGTPGNVSPLNAMGMLPTENFKHGVFDEAKKISGETLNETIKIGQEGCYACPVKCKRIVELKNELYKVEKKYGGPEYETIASFGSYCKVNDLGAIAKANELCNKYGLDTISTGGMIAYAMECYENGFLTKKDTNGVELCFGNAVGMVNLVEDIANREGLGDILADGPIIAAEKIGEETKIYAMHVKGQILPAHEPRGKVGVGLSYALAPQGADHVTAEHDTCFTDTTYFLKQLYPLGILEPVDARDLSPKKVRMYIYLQQLSSLHNVLCLCNFTSAVLGVLRLKDISNLVEAATGWETSVWELMKSGERGINLARVFNNREGVTNKEDVLPDRIFNPLADKSPLACKGISKNDFQMAIKSYYEMMNWSENGTPRKAKLEELNIGWLADIIST